MLAWSVYSEEIGLEGRGLLLSESQIITGRHRAADMNTPWQARLGNRIR